MKRLFAGTVALAGVSVVLGACGGSTTPSAPAPGSSTTVTTSPAAPAQPSTTAPSSSAPTTSQPATPTPPAVHHLRHHLVAHLQHGTVSGVAEFHADHGQRTLEIRLDHAKGLAHESLDVYVGGVKAGTLHISANGTGHTEWATEHGQKVPDVKTGTKVELKTASGKVVADGHYKGAVTAVHARDLVTHFANGAVAGTAEYSAEHGQRKVDLHLKATGLAGKNLSLFVGGVKVGTVRISAKGLAHREWATEHGQNVPTAAVGTKVELKTASGKVLATGTYAVHHVNAQTHH